MWVLFEGFRSGFDNSFHIHYENFFNFPDHIHRSYELVVMLEGEITVTVGSRLYTLTSGQGLIIFPHQRHAYSASQPHKTLVFIFSPGRVPAFHRRVEKQIPRSPIFSLQDALIIDILRSVTRESFLAFRDRVQAPMMIKGLLYMLLSPFLDQCELVDRSTNADTNLIEEILLTIEEAPIDQLSLQSIADQIGYNYAYLSKYFCQNMGITFTNYVNYYRIHSACQILREERCKIMDVALQVGYSNLRSFNGNFKKVTGITPQEFINGVEPQWMSTGPIVTP